MLVIMKAYQSRNNDTVILSSFIVCVFMLYLLTFPRDLALGFVFLCVCVCEREREKERGRRVKGRRKENGEEGCVFNGTLESESHSLLLRSNSVVCYAPLPGIF